MIRTPRPNTIAGDGDGLEQNCKSCTAPDCSGPMVACDCCGDWFHQKCVGVSKRIRNHKWVCEKCVSELQATQAIQKVTIAHSHRHPLSTHSEQLQCESSQRRLSHGGQLQRSPSHCEQLQHEHSQRISTHSEQLQRNQSQLELSHRNLLHGEPSQQSPSHAQKSHRNARKSNLASQRSRTSSKLATLELQRVDEERALKEKRDREYLDKRYEVLQRMAEQNETESEFSVTDDEEDCAQERVNQWLQRGAKVGNGKTVLSQGPNLPQIASNEIFQDVNAPQVTHTAALSVPVVLQPNAAQHQSGMQNKSAQFYGVPQSVPIITLSSDQIAARHVMPKELPLLYGYPEEWPLFNNSFESTTRICGYSNEENLIRLQRCLKGKALEAVRSRLLLPSNVPGIISTLRMLYGRPELIINSLLQKVRSEPAPKVDKLETLVTFSLSVQNLCATMESTGLNAHLNNPMILQELTDKLPSQTKLNWAIHRQSLPTPNLSTFNDWLSQLALSISEVSLNVIYQPTASEHKQSGSKGIKNFVNTHSEKPSGQVSKPRDRADCRRGSEGCCVCQKSCSAVQNCEKFKGLTLKYKWAAVRQYNLCRTCLSTHVRGRCKSSAVCGKNNCTYRHHPLLHNDKPNTFRRDELVTEGFMGNIHQMRNQSILFRILPVVLHGKNKTIETFAFLDDGSSLTLIEQELADRLELDGEAEPLCLKWTANTHRIEEQSKIVSFDISGIRPRTAYPVSNAHTVKSLNLPRQTITGDVLKEKFKHLKGIPIDSYEHAFPRLLIGLDHWKLGMTLKFREGGEHEPIAAKTRLGWSIYGPMVSEDRNHFAQQDHFQGIHMCECQQKNDDELQHLVKEYFSIDSFGVANPTKSLLSVEDQRCKEILESTTIRVGSRFETGLLWRYDNVTLPNSLPMAINRFRCLEKKMSSQPDVALTLKQRIGEYLAKGYIHKMSKAELEVQSPRTWYLPIFTVINPNKPGKMRIVWDAAAKVKGTSLNSMLLKGPDQLTSLPAVLYRFRERHIAISADICEMFHQVRIKSEDQHSQRFLWRDDPTSDFDTYVMEVMTFGASCSPSSAQFIKNKNAKEFSKQFPRAVKAILENHYVDDLLDSVDTEEEAVQLAEDIKFVHRQGGFVIRNWISNSKRVIRAIGEKVDQKQKCLDSDTEIGMEKVLGMWWSTSNDSFSFHLSSHKTNEELLSRSRRPTKRQVLKVIMKVFDPLGLIAHYMVFVKILLQHIWRSSIGWDDEITDDQYEKWLYWIKLLPKVQAIRIPRCYLSKTFSNMNETQLHIFVDASEDAFAAVAYARFKNDDKVHCSLIGAKTRVAPVKLLSIPRLELQAAVLGARLAKSIVEHHSIHFDKRVFWSDSKTVLSWINSDHRRYKQFVAFRIGEILDLSETNEWHWVPTKDNVADEATKWQKLPDLSSDSRWYTGPQFLQLSEDEWPSCTVQVTKTPEEEMRVHMIHNSTKYEGLIEVSRFSSWRKLLRTAAFVIRAVSIMKSKIKIGGPLSNEEYQAAENLIYRQAQMDRYVDEVSTLLGNRPIKKTSLIFKNTPYLDNEKVLRSYGRIDAVPGISMSTKRPILLPKRHDITRLVVDSFHRRYHHHNNETVINEVRQVYCIPQLRAMLKSVRKSCAMCIIRNAAPCPPQMAELPPARLATFTRPFTYVGLDYFGPITVAIGRRAEKRWGMLLTCLTTRAVHIEVAHTLSTDSCLLSLRNFIARRGTPNEVYCDNGTNFHGVEHELRKALSAIKSSELANELGSTTIKWMYNPPAAPHMGGSWERLVRSVKTTLYAIMPTRNPSDELLRSMLIEVENVINSRPLTYVPIDDIHQEALTPNHFLLGSSNGTKPIGEFSDSKLVLRKNWMTAQCYANAFWKKWVQEYLPTLTRRTKWFQPAKPIEPGDVVIIVDDKSPRNSWPKGVVLEVKTGKDGQVRRATIQTTTGVYERPAVKLAVLDVRDDNVGKPVGNKTAIPGGNVAKSHVNLPQVM